MELPEQTDPLDGTCHEDMKIDVTKEFAATLEAQWCDQRDLKPASALACQWRTSAPNLGSNGGAIGGMPPGAYATA